MWRHQGGGWFAKYEFRRGVGERKDMKHVNIDIIILPTVLAPRYFWWWFRSPLPVQHFFSRIASFEIQIYSWKKFHLYYKSNHYCACFPRIWQSTIKLSISICKLGNIRLWGLGVFSSLPLALLKPAIIGSIVGNLIFCSINFMTICHSECPALIIFVLYVTISQYWWNKRKKEFPWFFIYIKQLANL